MYCIFYSRYLGLCSLVSTLMRSAGILLLQGFVCCVHWGTIRFLLGTLLAFWAHFVLLGVFLTLKYACIIMILLLRNYYYFYESLYLGLAKSSHQTSTLSSSPIGSEHYLLLFLLSLSVLIFCLNLLSMFPLCIWQKICFYLRALKNVFTELQLFDLPGGKYSKIAFDSSVKTL